MINYWLSKTSEEIFATFPHDPIVTWLYQTARFIVSDHSTKERRLELWQRLVRGICDLAEKYLDFGDDTESFEKAILISNPYYLEKIDTQGMKPGWAELEALKCEALVDRVVTNLYQPRHLNSLRRAYMVARACATSIAKLDPESQKLAREHVHTLLLNGFEEHGFGYVPVTLVKDFMVQSHREIAIAPYAMREYYFQACSDTACPDGKTPHAHLVVWNTSFWMEPEEFPPVYSLDDGQRFITKQFGDDKLHPRNLSDLIASLEQCFAHNTA
jgi:hypothetical protein